MKSNLGLCSTQKAIFRQTPLTVKALNAKRTTNSLQVTSEEHIRRIVLALFVNQVLYLMD